MNNSIVIKAKSVIFIPEKYILDQLIRMSNDVIIESAAEHCSRGRKSPRISKYIFVLDCSTVFSHFHIVKSPTIPRNAIASCGSHLVGSDLLRLISVSFCVSITPRLCHHFAFGLLRNGRGKSLRSPVIVIWKRNVL